MGHEFLKSQIGVGHENFKDILGRGQNKIGHKIYIIISSAKWGVGHVYL